MRRVPLSEIKEDLPRYLHEAEKREIVITRHGEPAGVLIGFESEDDWFEYASRTTRGFWEGWRRRERACERDEE